MSEFSCPIVKILSITSHPGADRLSIVRLENLGFTAITNKTDEGLPRYKDGDLVCYIPTDALLPTWLLKEMHFWDNENQKGLLNGPEGNRIKPIRLRGVFSEGVLFPVDWNFDSESAGWVIRNEHGDLCQASLGQDVSDVLGITKYIPHIPVQFAGELANLREYTVNYDFEKLESNPDMFCDGEQVTAQEKLHGTMTAIRYIPGLNHPDMFGDSKNIIVHSKGLGKQGFAFKNVDVNNHNTYVKQLKVLLDNGFERKLKELSDFKSGATITVMGETFGSSIQDLNYGLKTPEFRVFDIQIDTGWATSDVIKAYADSLGVTLVPTLYDGPFDLEELEKVRDGKTTVGGDHVREGIVIRSMHGSHPIHGRKIAKMISPAYALRKSKSGVELTEFN